MKKKYHKVSKIYYYGFVCEQILYSDWQGGLILPFRDLPHYSRKKMFSLWPQNKSFFNQACSVKMVGYWPHSFFAYYDVNFV